MARRDALVDGLVGRLSPVWLAQARWFRAKRRGIAALRGIDAAPLVDDRIWLLVLGVGYVDGGKDRYLVPLVDDPDGVREPLDGEGAWRALLGRVARGVILRGIRGGVFSCEPTPALTGLIGPDPLAAESLEERRLGVEQSNTSVVLGDRVIVKLYRRLEDGINPEVEMSAFLAGAGFHQTPALGGSVTYRPPHAPDAAGLEADVEIPPSAVAMVQELAPADSDGWEWALACLARDDGIADFIAGAARIGEITAALHAALASRPEQPAFAVRSAEATDIDAWRASAARQLELALDALDGPDRARLEALAPALGRRVSGLATAGEGQVTRVHGDYHLGQILRLRDGDFSIIDFEGEPARPLEERRLPGSPLRDVAGMLRSFDYASRTAARRRGASVIAAQDWAGRARDAFLAAYRPLGAGERAALAVFELEKACYEVRYEANNRPGWTWLPLDALDRLAR
jgi:trehalose synthase-fused probable maltokinase